MPKQGKASRDPSQSSYYVGDDFYRGLVDAFADFDRTEREIADGELREAARRLLEREARLLDRHDYDAWLALYAPECAYWIPATSERGDPRREITITFDDRRRLEDRVYRLKTGFAWSQTPRSRTVRAVTNVEVFAGPSADVLMARSVFMLDAFRDGERQLWSGWNGHRLIRAGDAWMIEAKQVNLIDRDQNLRNPSFVL